MIDKINQIIAEILNNNYNILLTEFYQFDQDNSLPRSENINIIAKNNKFFIVIDDKNNKIEKSQSIAMEYEIKNNITSKLNLKKEQINIVFINNSKQENKIVDKAINNTESNDNNLTTKSSNKIADPHLKKMPKGIKKIILIASTKGGVGKSTMATNIAVALQINGLKIALVDADIYGPSIVHLMNIGIENFGGKENRQLDIENNLIKPIIAHNIKVMSLGLITDSREAGIWRGPMVSKIINQLIYQTNWQGSNNDEEVDVMIVDMPPGTGDSYISMAKQFDIAGVILVSTPQKLAVIDLVRSFDSFDKLNIPIIGIIENMSYLNIKRINYFALIINKILNKNIINKRIANKIKIFGDKALAKIANKYKIEVIANIPIDKDIDSANEFGIPVLISRPKSTVSKLFNQLAIKLIKDGINN